MHLTSIHLFAARLLHCRLMPARAIHAGCMVPASARQAGHSLAPVTRATAAPCARCVEGWDHAGWPYNSDGCTMLSHALIKSKCRFYSLFCSSSKPSGGATPSTVSTFCGANNTPLPAPYSGPAGASVSIHPTAARLLHCRLMPARAIHAVQMATASARLAGPSPAPVPRASAAPCAR